MARFGYLFLRGGVLDRRSIIAGDWIDSCWTQTGVSPWDWGPLPEGKYGLHWWLGNMSGYEIFFASGRGGQQIILVPALDLVIVTTTDTVSWLDSTEKWYAMLRLAAYQILTGIKSSLGLPPYPPGGFTSRKVLNRALVYREYIDVLEWRPEPRNEGAGAAAAKFRVYICDDDRLELLAEVDGRTFGYLVRRAGRDGKNLYAVTTVTADGRESLPAYAWGISPPVS
jgi:hypothetical protein